ncbi:MAG: RdgB/HAM1 family non-canonical purine NTP pyrophosphatase [Lentisphaeria bacterium]|nr:RdgB/HAM1 family non-canonical purine NTP pyrophosphatase [Lentisphaeria bacterium]
MLEKKLYVATGNTHKVEEIAGILAPLGIQVSGMDAFGGMPAVVEDGDTFEANSAKKARVTAATLGVPVLADDSGLSVEALQGAPGVYSARFAGPDSTDEKNMLKLLEKMREIPNRRAKFVCVISVADATGALIGQVRGEVPGSIIHAPRGSGGFGYDLIFVPAGYDQTFAELPGSVKNALSHRGNALTMLISSNVLTNLFTLT